MKKEAPVKKKLTTMQRQARAYRVIFIFVSIIILLTMILSQIHR